MASIPRYTIGELISSPKISLDARENLQQMTEDSLLSHLNDVPQVKFAGLDHYGRGLFTIVDTIVERA